MSKLYLIVDQYNHFLEKSGEWTDTLRTNQVYRTIHKDEALNELLELNAKHIEFRLRIIEANLTEKGLEPLEPLPKIDRPVEELIESD